MAVDCLVGSASSGPWVAESSRGRLGEETARGFRRELRDPVHA